MIKDPVELLLVEDNPSDEELALHVLQKNNLANRIQVVRDGAEALEFLFGDTAESVPRLILLDLTMPGMDGYETIRLIRGNPLFGRLPIVALTAKAMKGDREKCLEAEASDYLAKPVNTEQLLTTLRLWLHR